MTKKNEPEPLTPEDMKALQRRLYEHVSRRLLEEDPPAAVLQTAYKMTSDARIDLDTGDVYVEQLMEELPDHFKTEFKKPEWKGTDDDK